MLVLSRRAGEEINIGEYIVVKVLKSGPTHVKIGIEAPSEIRVERSELTSSFEQSRRESLLRRRPRMRALATMAR